MYLRLKLTPEAKRETFTRVGADKFDIQVKEKAINNLANRRALYLLAEHLKVKPADCRIISGHHQTHKIIHIRQV